MAEELSLHEIDPSTVPLPASRNSTEPSSVPRSAIGPLTPQEPERVGFWGPLEYSSTTVFDNYTAYRRYLNQEHSDLYGNLGRLPFSPPVVHASILDIDSSNAANEVKFSIEHGKSNEDFRSAIQNAKQTPGIIRVIIVEDINDAAVNILGEELDLDPTFFFNHIKGSSRDQNRRVHVSTVLASTKQAVQQGVKSIRVMRRDEGKLAKTLLDHDDGELEIELENIRNKISRVAASLKACFVHTVYKDPGLRSYESKYREGIRKHYHSMDWNKIVILNEMEKGFSPHTNTTYRDCFSPDVRDLSEHDENDPSLNYDLTHTILGSTNYLVVDPGIREMLKERKIHGTMMERLSTYDLEVGQQATTIILCDPLPTFEGRAFYDLWQQRGPWYHETGRISSALSRSQSTKDCLVSWLTEAVAKTSTGKAQTGSTFPFILELIRRDALTTFEYVQLRTRQIQNEMLSDQSPENNFRAWREWLSDTFYRLAQSAESLNEFLDTYGDSVIDEISMKKKWTSLSPLTQLGFDLPVTYYLGGRATDRELIHGRKAIQPLLKKFESSQQTLQRTDELLKNTLSLKESQRAISEAQSVTKLTELAFIFIPLSFTTSFLSMPLDVLNGSISLATFVTFAIVVLGGAYALRILVRASFIRRFIDELQTVVRQRSGLAPSLKIPNSSFVTFAFDKLRENPWSPAICTFSATFILPTILTWTVYHGNIGLRGGLTVLYFVLWLAVIILYRYDVFRKASEGWLLRTQGGGVIKLPDAANERQNKQASILIMSWWLLRLSMILVSSLALLVIIWAVLPSSIGSKIGLTAATLFVAPLLWIALKLVLMEQKVGRRFYRSLQQFGHDTLISIKLFIKTCVHVIGHWRSMTNTETA